MRTSATTKDLFAAIVAAQSCVAGVKKGAVNPAFKRDGKPLRYAELADHWTAIRPALKGYGLAIVQELNARPEIDGILVQMPLPKHVDTQRVLDAISPEKDVDGFHPTNVGNLSIGRPSPRPCTPSGVMELLRRAGIPVAGKHAVVVGRSDIVGKPMAMLLLHAHATVTVCHSRTADLAAECQRADILVGAIGRPAMLTRAHMKPGAVMIDVGINRLDKREDVVRIFGEGSDKVAAFDKRGSVLVGDMHPYDAAELSSHWTPVPGGVGPLTIAMLMVNTVEAAERRQA